jgi:predicted DNA binding CopG/RHH family protein
MSTKKMKVPAFRTEAAERAFWAKHDSAGFIDWSAGERARFPNLKPSLRTISLRLPESMLAELKLLANKKDVPYQSLLKVYLAQRIREEIAAESK